jgi:hypothetical protein
MTQKDNAAVEYDRALDSAAMVVEAILSLNIPKQHKHRYLNQAIWHTTVPVERLKYRTRYISFKAKEVSEILSLLRDYRKGIKRLGHDVARELLQPNVLSRLALLGTIDKVTYGKLDEALCIEEKRLKSQLRHEHVSTRKDIIEELLKNGRGHAKEILTEIISCTVTREEHGINLERREVKCHKGIDRYRAAGIRVWDSWLEVEAFCSDQGV